MVKSADADSTAGTNPGFHTLSCQGAYNHAYPSHRPWRPLNTRRFIVNPANDSPHSRASGTALRSNTPFILSRVRDRLASKELFTCLSFCDSPSACMRQPAARCPAALAGGPLAASYAMYCTPVLFPAPWKGIGGDWRRAWPCLLLVLSIPVSGPSGAMEPVRSNHAHSSLAIQALVLPGRGIRGRSHDGTDLVGQDSEDSDPRDMLTSLLRHR